MGNQQSLSEPQNNSKFSNYQLTQSKNKKMIITMNIYSQTNDLVPFLEIRNHQEHIYNHQNIFSPKFIKIVNDGLCNDSCAAIFEAQPYTDNLYDQIIQRKSIKRYYNQQQIWFLLSVICKVSQNIYKHGKKFIIGNLHPKNILINCQGNIKVITVNSLPYQTNHYTQYCLTGIEDSYMTPQTMGFISKTGKNSKNMFPSCLNRQTSQAFTLGMTLLSMCSLYIDLSQFYDTSFYFQYPQRVTTLDKSQSSYIAAGRIKRNINQAHSFKGLLNNDNINQQLTYISLRYSTLLSQIIRKLLKPDPEKRITIKQIYDEIIEPNISHIEAMDRRWASDNNLFISDDRDKKIREFQSYYV